MLSTNQKIGKIVKILREEEDITQSVLAKKLNVQVRAISQLENGKVSPSIKSLEVLAKFFNKPLKYFLDFNFIKMKQSDKERIASINEDLLNADSEQIKLIQNIVKTIVYNK